MGETRDIFDEALLDLESKSNDEVRELLNDLHAEEQRISYLRRVLHGRMDILRAELVRRLKSQREAGEDVIQGSDIERLIDILASDIRGFSDVSGADNATDDKR